MSNFKKVIVRCRAFLDWLHTEDCVICRKTPCDPAHVRSGADGGTSMKPGDNNALPLCHEHHMEQHRTGEVIFWRKYLMMDDYLLMRCVRSLANHAYYHPYINGGDYV